VGKEEGGARLVRVRTGRGAEKIALSSRDESLTLKGRGNEMTSIQSTSVAFIGCTLSSCANSHVIQDVYAEPKTKNTKHKDAVSVFLLTLDTRAPGTLASTFLIGNMYFSRR